MLHHFLVALSILLAGCESLWEGSPTKVEAAPAASVADNWQSLPKDWENLADKWESPILREHSYAASSARYQHWACAYGNSVVFARAAGQRRWIPEDTPDIKATEVTFEPIREFFPGAPTKDSIVVRWRGVSVNGGSWGLHGLGRPPADGQLVGIILRYPSEGGEIDYNAVAQVRGLTPLGHHGDDRYAIGPIRSATLDELQAAYNEWCAAYDGSYAPYDGSYEGGVQ